MNRSAFPVLQDVEFCEGRHALDFSDSGMSLREWFAAQMMAALVSQHREATWENNARAAVQIADILLAELDRTKDGGTP